MAHICVILPKNCPSKFDKGLIKNGEKCKDHCTKNEVFH